MRVIAAPDNHPMRRHFHLALLPSLLLSSHCQAARPLVTDDARLTTAGSCQLETWLRADHQHQELWALPSCNPGGNLEITMGGGQAIPESGPRTVDYVFQAKTLFRPLTPGNWGWGLAIGTVRHPKIQPGPNLLGNTYAYLPFSLSMTADDRIVLHGNLGWLQDKARNNTSTTWGIGGEFRLSERLQGIAESFGDDHGRPYWQAGLRFGIVPERIQIDATIGRQLAPTETPRWFTLGLRLTPERLF